ITNKNSYNINKIKIDKKLLKILGASFSVLFIVSIFLLYSFLYSSIAIKLLGTFGLEKSVPVIFAFLGAFVSFSLSINRTKSMLFDSNDNDLLFSLPIKPSTILANRMINLLGINYMLCTAIFLPSTIVYGLSFNITFQYVISTILVTLTLPMIPTVMAGILGYVIAFATSKFGNKKILELIFTTTIFLGVFYVISSANQYINIIIQNLDKIRQIIKTYGYMFYNIYQAMFKSDMFCLAIFVIANILALVLFIAILANGYRKIIIKLKDVKIKKSGKKIKFSSSSLKTSLLKKEFKKFIYTPIYAFNTGFGVLLMIIATIYVVFINPNFINEILGTPGISDSIGFIGLILMSLFVLLTANTAACSISLEGKNLWILKSLPVETKEILKSKIIFNMLVTLPVILSCTIIIGVVIKLTILQIIATLIINFAFGVVIPQFGIIVNLKYPKLNFVSEAQVVKQSLSSFIGIMIPMVLLMIITVLLPMILTYISLKILVCMVILILIIIIIIQNMIINHWGVKCFNNL
ncbi:MAG: hypothetical protein RSA08_01830, partial [Clostridia bacterium]